MKNYYCPHCGEQISLSKKMFLDVRSKYKCKNCGGLYGVPWYAGILSIASMGAFVGVLTLIQSFTIKVLLCILIVIITIVINVLFIPIVNK